MKKSFIKKKKKTNNKKILSIYKINLHIFHVSSPNQYGGCMSWMQMLCYGNICKALQPRKTKWLASAMYSNICI